MTTRCPAPPASGLTRRAALTGMFAALSGCGGGGSSEADAELVPAPAPAVPMPEPAPMPPAPAPVPAPPPAPEPLPEQVPAPVPAPTRPSWYIDARAGSDTADGRSAATARKTLPPLLVSGESVLFRRGTTCALTSTFTPGTADLLLDAYLAPTDPADAARPALTTTGAGNFVLRAGGHEGLVVRNLRFAVDAGETGRPAVRLDIARALTKAPVFEDCDFFGDDGAFIGLIQAACAGLSFRRCSFGAHRAALFAFGASGCAFVAATLGSSAFAVTGMQWESNRFDAAPGPGLTIRSGSDTDDNETQFAGRFVDADIRLNRFERCNGHGVFLVCGFHPETTVDAAAANHGWDGLRFEDNVVADNASSGASIGPNLVDTARPTIVQRNTVRNNGRLKGTTGGLQLNGLRRALIQDNICEDNWTTATFDGVNLFMDVIGSSSFEMATAGAIDCVVRRNRCSGARGAGGRRYEDWIAEQNTLNSSNAPSSGIRLYFARGTQVYANLLIDNGSGVACDKSADNLVFNNTAVGCTAAYYDGVGLANRGNRFFNNIALDCDWDFYGLESEGWTTAAPSTAPITLDAPRGTLVRVSGPQQFTGVRSGVGGRNFFLREAADQADALGLAVVTIRVSEGDLQVHVLRPFSALAFGAGELLIGAVEAHRAGALDRNARFGARLGSVRALVAGATDLTLAPQLDSAFRPLPSSPLLARGLPVPGSAFGAPTDLYGVPLAPLPTLGAIA